MVILRKVIEIIWKVEPLPRPAVMNSTRKTQKNAVKLPPVPPEGNVRNSNALNIAITTKFTNVTRVPPRRSEMAPPAERASAPTNGPKNAKCRTCTSGNWVFDNMANPAEKPINEPNVARYRKLMIHKCERFSTGNCARKEALDVASSFIPNRCRQRTDHQQRDPYPCRIFQIQRRAIWLGSAGCAKRCENGERNGQRRN